MALYTLLSYTGGSLEWGITKSLCGVVGGLISASETSDKVLTQRCPFLWRQERRERGRLSLNLQDSAKAAAWEGRMGGKLLFKPHGCQWYICIVRKTIIRHRGL